MPLYEYECAKCGGRFEIIQKFSDDPVEVHGDGDASGCDGRVRKLLSAPAIQFKGSGWYVTDYGKGGQKDPKRSRESSEGAKNAASAKSGNGAKSSNGAGKASKNGSGSKAKGSGHSS